MDAGTGTAVLAILASKLGAQKVDAFDIDGWSITNGKENLEVNRCGNVAIRQGKISDLAFENDFDSGEYKPKHLAGRNAPICSLPQAKRIVADERFL
jgi:ribosomal protein L11 methylase PrmA